LRKWKAAKQPSTSSDLVLVNALNRATISLETAERMYSNWVILDKTRLFRVYYGWNRIMTIISEERPSDSPYIEAVTRGRTASDGSTIRPAEIHWHMVLRKLNDSMQLLVVGPWTSSGVIFYGAGAELLWIKFKLGAFMPHLPVKSYRDVETSLPGAASLYKTKSLCRIIIPIW
jgi:hypothetical protein